ncbi:lytic murein transglycosylase [Vibrio cyclitrophicus]
MSQEKRLTLDEYIPRAVPDWKVKKARRLYDEHYDDLKRIGDIYGVQAERSPWRLGCRK